MCASVILQQRLAPETETAFVISGFYVTLSSLCSGKPDPTPNRKKSKMPPSSPLSFSPLSTSPCLHTQTGTFSTFILCTTYYSGYEHGLFLLRTPWHVTWEVEILFQRLQTHGMV